MSNQTTKLYWLSDFQGMNQRQNADKIPSSQSPLLVNVTLSKPGTWIKRKGHSLLGASEDTAGIGVDGAITYNLPNGTTQIRKLVDGDIKVYNTGAGTWTVSASGVYTDETKVHSVNYKGRVYHVSEDDFLFYETGGAITEVGSGADRIKGQALAVAQNTLFLATDEKVYYSLFDITNNVPGDQFWNDSEGSLANSTRWFSMPSKVVTLFSYGTTNRVYAFTKNECFTFDVATADNAFGPERVFNIGCAGPRAITECNGWMIWMAPDGRIWGWGGAGPPIPFSWDIEDESEADAVIGQINKSEIEDVSARTDRNEFYFDVGNLTTFGRSLINVRIKGLLTQNLQRVLWSLDISPNRARIFFNGDIGGGARLFMGSEDFNNVYVVNETFNDQVTDTRIDAINGFCLTPFLDFGSPLRENAIRRVWIKYRPQNDEDDYLRVRYSANINTSYTDLSNPGSNVRNQGVIDMYNPNFATLRDEIKTINGLQEFRGHNISLEVGNQQLDGYFEISAIGFEVVTDLIDILPEFE